MWYLRRLLPTCECRYPFRKMRCLLGGFLMDHLQPENEHKVLFCQFMLQLMYLWNLPGKEFLLRRQCLQQALDGNVEEDLHPRGQMGFPTLWQRHFVLDILRAVVAMS